MMTFVVVTNLNGLTSVMLLRAVLGLVAPPGLKGLGHNFLKSLGVLVGEGSRCLLSALVIPVAEYVTPLFSSAHLL